MMAAAGKFKLNRGTVRHLLRADDGLKAAVHDIAEEMKDKGGESATVDDYVTDRVVSGIVVGAADQARDGVATKAAQQVAGEHAAKPFRSRAQWRFNFRAGRPDAAARARASGGYKSLPERAGKGTK